MNLRIFGFHGVSFANPVRRVGAFVTLLLAFCACSSASAREWAEENRGPWFGDYDSGYEDGFRDGQSGSIEERGDYRRGGFPTRPTRENPWVSAPQPGIRSEQDNPWADAQRFRSDPSQRDYAVRQFRDPEFSSSPDHWPREPSYRGPPWAANYGYREYDIYRPVLPYGAPVMPGLPGGYGLYGSYPYWGAYPGYPGFPGYFGYPTIGNPFGLGWPGGLLWH
jgi:hypothetical protein